MVEVKVHLIGSSIFWHSPQSTPAGVSCSLVLSARLDARHLGGYCDLFWLPGRRLGVALEHTCKN